MMDVKSIATTLMLVIFFGSIVVDLTNDVISYFSCSFCEDAKDKLLSDTTGVIAAGSNKIDDGVKGIKNINNLGVSEQTKDTLMQAYKTEITSGVIISIFYAFLLYIIFNKIGRLIMGDKFMPIIAVCLALLVIGIASWVFGGVNIYSSWWNFLSNWKIIYGGQQVSSLPLINSTNIY